MLGERLRGSAAPAMPAPEMIAPNEVTSADGGWRVLFALVAQWPAAAEFLRWGLGPRASVHEP